MNAPAFKVVIPARYGSTRLPAKALADLGGMPMVERVRRVAVASGAEEVLVATDDPRIADAVRSHGGEVVMTGDHPSGTDRVAEACRLRGWPEHAVVVNLQGDEPLLPPPLVARAAAALVAHPGASMATLACPLRDAEEALSPHVVKVLLSASGDALYFSRLPIAGPEAPWVGLRHLGIYAYRVGWLERYVGAPPPPIERHERLEQLRALWMGARITVAVVDDPPAGGVDTEADLSRVRAAFAVTIGAPRH